MAQGFMTIRQASDILQVSKLTVWRKTQAGEIPSTRLGRKILIPCEFFDRLRDKAFEPQGVA